MKFNLKFKRKKKTEAQDGGLSIANGKTDGSAEDKKLSFDKTDEAGNIILGQEEVKMLKNMVADMELMTEYYRMRQRPGRHILLGLVNGMARGVGFAIGVTVLAFILIKLLQALDVLDLPIIGDFIADLMEYVNNETTLSTGRY